MQDNISMDVRELRIGNLVQTHRRELNEIIVINTIATKYNSNEVLLATNMFPLLLLNQCDPIPLTEEWLERFGAEEKWSEKYELQGFSIILKEDNTWTFWIANSDDFGGSYFVNINYVHQLQNLYYALTGEELTYAN